MDADAEKMLRVRDGDIAGYGDLVRRYQGALINFFYKLVWDRQEAEDFAQDVFVKVFVARAHYEEKSKFSTYLFRVATNYWIDFLRTRGKRKKAASLDRDVQTADGTANLGQFIAAKTATPDDDLLRREQLERTREAIDALPEEQKLAFLLAEVQGMKYQEIAETLDLPLGTVKSRIHAAVLKLREQLAAKGIIG